MTISSARMATLAVLVTGLYAAGPLWAQDAPLFGEPPATAVPPGMPMMGMGGPGQGGMPMMGMGGPGQGGMPMMGMGGPRPGGMPMMGAGGPGQGGMPMMGMGGPGQGGMPMMGMGGPGQGGMPVMGAGGGQNCMARMPKMQGQGMGRGAGRQELALIEARLAKLETLLERLVQQR